MTKIYAMAGIAVIAALLAIMTVIGSPADDGAVTFTSDEVETIAYALKGTERELLRISEVKQVTSSVDTDTGEITIGLIVDDSVNEKFLRDVRNETAAIFLEGIIDNSDNPAELLNSKTETGGGMLHKLKISVTVTKE